MVGVRGREIGALTMKKAATGTMPRGQRLAALLEVCPFPKEVH